jgi:NADPH-dependent 2,4-dienoyl-CoA reductase/sulfur reductase-like enzyme
MQYESDRIDVESVSRDKPKRVLVIAGGRAGLQAARRTAFAAHQVTLCKSRGWLGGQIRFAAMIPGRYEFVDMLPWYLHQIEKHGVQRAPEHDNLLDERIEPG